MQGCIVPMNAGQPLLHGSVWSAGTADAPSPPSLRTPHDPLAQRYSPPSCPSPPLPSLRTPPAPCLSVAPARRRPRSVRCPAPAFPRPGRASPPPSGPYRAFPPPPMFRECVLELYLLHAEKGNHASSSTMLPDLPAGACRQVGLANTMPERNGIIVVADVFA